MGATWSSFVYVILKQLTKVAALLLLAVVPLSDVFDSYREILTYAVSTRPNSRSAAAS
tara:strand:- start:52 stop:225 length:174 start_codon:yes stop_codon:yes gene_type:complete